MLNSLVEHMLYVSWFGWFKCIYYIMYQNNIENAALTQQRI